MITVCQELSVVSFILCSYGPTQNKTIQNRPTSRALAQDTLRGNGDWVPFFFRGDRNDSSQIPILRLRNPRPREGTLVVLAAQQMEIQAPGLYSVSPSLLVAFSDRSAQPPRSVCVKGWVVFILAQGRPV